MNKEFYRGEIFYIRNESEYSGNVQGGGRPAVIISNDIGNNAGPILEVVYLTTQEKKPLPTHVKINSSKYPSTVLCEQIDTVNKDKVGDYIGQCSMAEMKKIDAALAVSIGIGINIKSNDLVKKWAEAANEAVKPDAHAACGQCRHRVRSEHLQCRSDRKRAAAASACLMPEKQLVIRHILRIHYHYRAPSSQSSPHADWLATGKSIPRKLTRPSPTPWPVEASSQLRPAAASSRPRSPTLSSNASNIASI